MLGNILNIKHFTGDSHRVTFGDGATIERMVLANLLTCSKCFVNSVASTMSIICCLKAL